MFLGHYALALAAKGLAPKTSLGTTALAANLADEVWPVLLVLGIEHVQIVPGILAASPFDFTDYPWSHSLVTGLGAGLLFAALYLAVRKYARGALVLGALVVSHWVLDLFFHRPDLPVWPGGPKLGLGLWGSVPVTVVCELAFLGAGLLIYRRRTEPVDRKGSIALWALIVFLLAIYLSSLFGPPPASARAVGWMTLGVWLIVPWGYYIDRHHRLRGQPA